MVERQRAFDHVGFFVAFSNAVTVMSLNWCPRGLAHEYRDRERQMSEVQLLNRNQTRFIRGSFGDRTFAGLSHSSFSPRRILVPESERTISGVTSILKVTHVFLFVDGFGDIGGRPSKGR